VAQAFPQRWGAGRAYNVFPRRASQPTRDRRNRGDGRSQALRMEETERVQGQKPQRRAKDARVMATFRNAAERAVGDRRRQGGHGAALDEAQYRWAKGCTHPGRNWLVAAALQWAPCSEPAGALCGPLCGGTIRGPAAT